MFKINIENYYGTPQSYDIETMDDLRQLLTKYNLNKQEFIGNASNPRVLADKFVSRISRQHITASIDDPEDREEIENPHYESPKKPSTISNMMDVQAVLEAPEDDTQEIEIPEHLVLQHSVNR
jgi:hypothetical protein